MKKALNLIIVSALAMMMICCGSSSSSDDDDGPREVYVDKLELAEDMSAYKLIDITDTFYGNPVDVYFRMESEENIAGRKIQIVISKNSGGGYTVIHDWEYPNVIPDENFYFSKIEHDDGAGDFKVDAYIINEPEDVPNKYIASATYTVVD